jgi:hypothetical protein
MPRHFNTITEVEADSRLRRLLSYWQEARNGRAYPDRAAVDPLKLKDLLGYLVLVDAVDQGGGRPPRFRYRLFGTGYTFYHGRDMTGKWVDEVAEPTFRDNLLEVYALAVSKGQPGFYAYDYIVDTKHHRFQACLLPLAADGAKVDMVLTCAVPLDAESP